jgi:hypothetical protein
MKPSVITFLLLFFIYSPKAQSQDSLHELRNQGFQVYYSSGHGDRAESIAMRIGHARKYHQELLQFTPTFTLMVLSRSDWKVHTTDPVIYGMPHYNEKSKRLIVSAEDNAFWKSFLPPLSQLPEELRKPVEATYGSSTGLSMQAFFDLLAIHELGHAFHFQGGLNMQRKWMGELFSNVLLHTYIADKEPGLLPALTLFPRMVVAGGAGEFTFTSLQDVHERYDEIALKYPKNYGWYQCRWHVAAAGIYDAGGRSVIKKFWNALQDKNKMSTDQELSIYLRKAGCERVAEMMDDWEQDIIK